MASPADPADPEVAHHDRESCPSPSPLPRQACAFCTERIDTLFASARCDQFCCSPVLAPAIFRSCHAANARRVVASLRSLRPCLDVHPGTRHLNQLVKIRYRGSIYTMGDLIQSMGGLIIPFTRRESIKSRILRNAEFCSAPGILGVFSRVLPCIINCKRPLGKLRLSSNRLNFMFSGGLLPRKGVNVLLKA